MKRKNNIDEMQEQKLLKIESRGFWLAYWGLVAAIFIQTAMGNSGFQYIGGESIILIIISLYTVVDCIRNGIWDRKLKPDFKTNLLLSLAAGLAVGIFWFIVSYHRYHALAGSFATFAMMFIMVSVLVFVALSITSGLYKHKKNKIDKETDEEEFGE